MKIDKGKIESQQLKLTLVVDNDEINTIVIATRHDSHADMVMKSLESRKNIFCEKPLALTLHELKMIDNKYRKIVKGNKFVPIIMVGFNRRFSPLIKYAKKLLKNEIVPKVVVITVNAGEIEKNSWIHDPKIGGGRIIGEACHFIDLARFLADSRVNKWDVIQMHKSSFNEDKVVISLQFEDGSIAVINYLANGNKAFIKERVEVFSGGKILQINNFNNLKTWGWANESKTLLKQNKGNEECVKSFVSSIISGQPSPIAYEELYEVSRLSIEISQKAKN